MTTSTLHVLLEEQSAHETLQRLLPRVAPDADFALFAYRGKPDLLRKLPQRLAGYAAWAPAAGIAVLVLVDRDDDDCLQLKQELESHLRVAGLVTPAGAAPGTKANALVRIIIEELEAWFFGDPAAVAAAFPGVPASLGERAAFRDPDAVRGGTWQQFEKVLQDAGHHVSGLRKLEAARAVASHMDVENNRSHSFRVFRDGVRSLVKESA